ncbi:hypothetical protein ACRXCV_00120 (plasmid) [Halobacteriovorax sp. GFR7]|uniref:hypothetical protein n=1 Tax=unclassified Halobacteriovorax TaxID=2639665 RepID=UPI003D99C67C
MLNKVNSKAQLKTAIEQLGFDFVSAIYYPHCRNTMFKCWDLKVAYQGTEYYLEANTVQELLDEVKAQLL